jgi:hypothetical protein
LDTAATNSGLDTQGRPACKTGYEIPNAVLTGVRFI